jgi:uncharacterized membrane protein YbhN (UPF0104 family)
MDMYVASVLAFIAGAYAFVRGAPWIASSILLVGGLVVVGNTIAVAIVILRGSLTVPAGIFRFLSRFIGEDRADRLQNSVQEGTHTFAVAAKALFQRERLGLLVNGFVLTIVNAVLSGLSLWIVLAYAGLHIDLFTATFVSFGVGTLASLPVSIGGSGISELAMQSYLGSVYGFWSWAPVIVWRIATYHIILGFCGVVFVYLMMKMTGRTFKRPRYPMIERWLEKPLSTVRNS